MKKKAQVFGQLTAAMVGLLTLFLVLVVLIITVSQTKQTSLLCENTFDDGGCWACTNVTDEGGYTYNSTSNLCHNASSDGTLPAVSTGTAAWNGTTDIQEAVAIAPQFSPIIVIAVIGVVLLGLFGGMQLMKRR